MHHSQHTSEASDSRCVDFTQFGWNSSGIEVTPPLKPCDSGGSLAGTASAELRTATLGRELQRRGSALFGIWILVMTFGFMSASPRLFAQAKPSPPPLPREPHFYSAQQIQKGVMLPPLPANPFPDLDLYPLGGGDYAYDDRDVDYDLLREQAELEKALTAALIGGFPFSTPLDYGPEDHWLEIHGTVNGPSGEAADLTIHTPVGDTHPSHDVWFTPTLDPPNWRFTQRCYHLETNVPALSPQQGFYVLTQPRGNLEVSATPVAEALARMLLPNDPSINVFSAHFHGHAAAHGSFWSGYAAGLPIDDGVILASGPISEAPGPNDDNGDDAHDNGTASLWPTPGDSALDSLVDQHGTLDATVLEFDFESLTPFVLRFRYIYASEEYPEFIGDFNDPMAIFIGPVGSPAANVALVPGTTLPVNVNTINGGCVASYFPPNNSDVATNPIHYLDNGDPRYDALDPWSTERLARFSTQYDGLTVPLSTEEVQITAHTRYHVKIAVADYAGPYDDDREYSSAVFLGRWSDVFFPIVPY